MLRSNIIDISYARISTGATAQLSSLGNQFRKLQELNAKEIVTHVGSGGSTMPPSLKSKILEHYDKNVDIKLNVIAFDRLTRNFSDLDFLTKYVKYIHVLEENKTYDMVNDIEYIVSRITKGIQELNIIKNRNLRMRASQPLQKLSGQIRSREESESTDIINEKKIVAIKNRCRSVSNNIETCGIRGTKLQKLEKFIRISQKLNTKEKWNEMFSLMKQLGLCITKIKKNYVKYIKDCKDNNTIYKITKKEVVDFVTEILKVNKAHNNEIFVNQFINSNIKYGKNIGNTEIEESYNENVDSLLNSLAEFNFDHSDINKLEALIKAKRNLK
jgi:hypothetical protein